ncbi:MAG: putative PEP-binding protein [Nanoarchaeota archaeon]
MQRYNFVSGIERITQEELARLRTSPKGSHIDLILKECLLDAEYDQGKLDLVLSSQNNLWMINSFPDIHPFFKDSCEGDLLRSEFLFLRYLGDGVFDQSKRAQYVKYLEEKVLGSLPQKVIFRLCDYNNQDFNFLRSDYSSRGAARLLEQGELLETDLEVIKLLQRSGRDVKVLVPYVLFPEEFADVKKRVKESVGNVNVGTMLEVPANLLEIDKYSEADFYVFGPGDLTKSLYGGIDRNSPNFSLVNNGLAVPMVKDCLDTLERLGQRKTVYLVKNLIGRDFGEHKNLCLVNMYSPSQLAAGARK